MKRKLCRLIELGQLKAAMELSLELLKEGSHQVEMSDEGLMTEEIEECLSVVIEAVKQNHLPAHEVITRCSAMLKTDLVGFICERDLQTQRDSIQVSES